MSNIFKLYPTHFSRGGEQFSKGGFAPPCYGLALSHLWRGTNRGRWKFLGFLYFLVWPRQPLWKKSG